MKFFVYEAVNSTASLRIRLYAQRLGDAVFRSPDSGQSGGPADFRVIEGLRGPLSALVGAKGFSVLLSRALALATAESGALRTVEVKRDGLLGGVDAIPHDLVREANTTLVAQLLELLTAFVGEPLLLQILQDIWPELALSQNALEEIEDDERR